MYPRIQRKNTINWLLQGFINFTASRDRARYPEWAPPPKTGTYRTNFCRGCVADGGPVQPSITVCIEFLLHFPSGPIIILAYSAWSISYLGLFGLAHTEFLFCLVCSYQWFGLIILERPENKNQSFSISGGIISRYLAPNDVQKNSSEISKRKCPAQMCS